MIQFILNNKLINTSLTGGMVMVDFIRYHQQLMGTKIGCREGDCGACTILTGALQGEELHYCTVTSCLMPLANARGKHIVTIEGINTKEPNIIQQAMNEEGATQCGFCTPGFVMSITGLCLGSVSAEQTDKEQFSPQKLVAAVDGNICRCTGYKSIERAALRVGNFMQGRNDENPVEFLTTNAVLPAYFSGIKERLQVLKQHSEEIMPPLNGQAFFGGGTDLYVQQPAAMAGKAGNYMLGRPELKGITDEHNRCTIGGSVTVSELLASESLRKSFPNLTNIFKLVSSTPIRNMATISGNFINASPIGDLTIFFLALNAHLILSDGYTTRQIALHDLYEGYKLLAKKTGEFIQQIWCDLPGENAHFNFEKVSKRTHLDIASVNTALLVSVNEGTITNARLSAGGVAPVPLFLVGTSSFLQGKELSVDTVRDAIDLASEEISPVSDVRGTATYKRLLLKQLIKAHFITLFPHLKIEELISV